MRVLLSFAEKISLELHNSVDTIDTNSSYKNITLSFICIEEGDKKKDSLDIAEEIKKHSFLHKSTGVVLLPFAHLSPFATNNYSKVRSLLMIMSEYLTKWKIINHVREPAKQDVLFSEFILFDGNVSTHLRCSENALRSEIVAMKRIFGTKIIKRILEEEK